MVDEPELNLHPENQLSDIAILKEMIQETATVSLENDLDRRNKVILREPKKPPNYYVTIHGMPDDDNVIIINPEEFKSLDTIFKGNRGERKRADFTANCHQTRNKNPTPNPLPASDEGAKMYLI
ncbi:MAG: hypothetical protein WCO29_06865 [Nostocales cyanobacterium ELA583]|jgi:hypothetical protein